MFIADFETVTPSISDAIFPVRLEMKTPTLRPAILLALVAPLAILLLAPLAVIALEIVVDPATRANLAAHPGSAALISAGLLLMAVLVGWPLLALFERIGRQRIVLLDREVVSVTDSGLFASHAWRQPLSSYLGLTHHMRTTHAGTRHELILVHLDPAAHVLLEISTRITDVEMRKLADRLGVPIVPPTALYSRMRLPHWMSRTGRNSDSLTPIRT